MDCDSLDYLEVRPPMIYLKSSNGEIFQVEVKAAKLSLRMKEMLDELGVEENQVLSIPESAPQVSGTILGKIIQWANHHKNDPAEDDETEVKSTNHISSWDAEFLQVDPATLFQMIQAAKYLHIKGLLEVSCKKVAELIKGKTGKEVRQRLNIPTDFSPEEEEQVRRENGWYEEEFYFGPISGPINGAYEADLQAVEHEASHVIENCLNNSEVVKNICKHVSSSQLLKLSTLNSTWSYEAVRVVKKRGNIMARLPSNSKRSCKRDFEAFGQDLRRMAVVPYSGITIEIRSHGRARQPAAVDPTLEAILARLPIKHLSVILHKFWLSLKDCPALLLVKRILEDFSGILEELTLWIGDRRGDFIHDIIRCYDFPSLKVLNLGDDDNTSDESYANYYIKELLSRAPNLQKLQVDGRIDLTSNVMEGTKAVLVYREQIHAPFHDISESLIAALRPMRLTLQYTGPEFDLERFQRISPMLLKASCSEPCSMYVDAELAVLLMCYGICLEKVNDLVIAMPRDPLEPDASRILSIVRNLDFTRIFPGVDRVSIYNRHYAMNFRPDHMRAIFEQADAFLGEPMPDRAAYIKELCVSFTIFSAPYFAQMLPNIEKLKILGAEQEIGSIWEHWVELKELEVNGELVQSTRNLGASLLSEANTALK